jgi:hypothetical protein
MTIQECARKGCQGKGAWGRIGVSNTPTYPRLTMNYNTETINEIAKQLAAMILIDLQTEEKAGQEVRKIPRSRRGFEKC